MWGEVRIQKQFEVVQKVQASKEFNWMSLIVIIQPFQNSVFVSYQLSHHDQPSHIRLQQVWKIFRYKAGYGVTRCLARETRESGTQI